MNGSKHDSTTPGGINLCLTKSTPSPVHPERCIICQKKNKKSETLHGGTIGRKRVRDAAEQKNDDVHKRLRTLGSDFEFKYHNSYACYKKYTDIRNLSTTSEEQSTSLDEEPAISDSFSNKPFTRSSTVPRPGPSPPVKSLYTKCVICACERVWLKKKGVREREKFRLCKNGSAQKFLDAMNYHKDDVYVRCADLSSSDDIFAADLYCHKFCFQKYTNFKQTDPTCETKTNPKIGVFNDVISVLDPFIKSGYGFTISEIKEMMLDTNNNIELYNRDVKTLLQDHYGDKIQFSPSHRVNEPEMCFSAEITVEDLTKSLRNRDIVRSAGEILREALQKVDFKLTDRFCDGSELRESWEQTHMPDQLLTFFSALFGIGRSEMLNIEMLNMDVGDCDDDKTESDDEASLDDNNYEEEQWAVTNQYRQLNCLFQIMYYQLFHGTKKTPLTTSFGQYQYGKSRSREILTVANRMGVSSSYNSIRRARQLLAAYAVAKSNENEVPVPSTFTVGAYVCGAMDNGDFGDRSSLSGTESDHVTMQVLFQEKVSAQDSKCPVSEMNLGNINAHLPEKLPCQEVAFYLKPSVKPCLPANFKVLEETSVNSNLNCESALCEADKREFLISLIRCGLPPKNDTNGCVPTWGGAHALLSTADVPLMRVGFMPMIPSPVTDYATVRKALQNFQSVRRQINPNQSIIPVFCDEGVYHTLADIVMDEPDEFADIHGMMGMFHWVKILLKCAGRYLQGSGIEDALIETDVFGKLTLNSVLEGSHYVRSFHGIIMISDLMSSLAWAAFWQSMEKSGNNSNADTLKCAGEVRTALCEKTRCIGKFAELVGMSSELQEQFNSFLRECCGKSEMCEYLEQFQHMASVIKHAVASDREGNFHLHISSVEKSLAIFREHDCLNYLRYGSYYLESTKTLEATHPEIFKCFLRGQFVVKDKGAGNFNAVAPDMKLEQSIQRSSKSVGGIVGQTKNLAIAVEWQLIFHEILLISNNFREIMNDISMDHSESARVHHELTGRKADMLNKNVARLLDYVNGKGNPYIIEVPGIKLHNLVTKQLADKEVALRLLQLQENGDRLIKEFRNERFLQKTKKLSATISKRNLPKMDFKPSPTISTTLNTVSSKMIAAAQREIEIIKERGMSFKTIYSYDILPISPIFEGDLPSKPDKSTLISDLEKNLATADMNFSGGNLSVVVDFMSKIRSFPNLSSFETFDRAINCALAAGRSICTRTRLHVVFDSYLESTIKACERFRRARGVGSVDLKELTSKVPVPKQLDKFWTSPSNKTKLQLLTRELAFVNPELCNIVVVLSGCVTDEEIVPAQLLHAGRSPAQTFPECSEIVEALTCNVEEADDRLVRHCAWEVDHETRRLLVISNDTDTIVRLLYFIPQFREKGLQEMWVEYGTGERRRHLPLHILADKLGTPMSKVIVKAHVLTGDDALSKIGTKHAALLCEPLKFLTDFAESDQLTEDTRQNVEQYLVRIWAGAKSKTESKTFDQLRMEWHIRPTTPKSLEALPPTSSVITGHIMRSFYVIRNIICLLDDTSAIRNPINYCWVKDNDLLLPDKCLKPLPHELLETCKCTGKCDTRRCCCKKAEQKCVLFCHAQQHPECQNK